VARQVIYQTIIFQDFVFEEIQRLQEELSQSDKKIWSISSVINLLLGFYFEEKNEPIYTQKFSFLQDYLDGKSVFLNKFVSDILISSTSSSQNERFWL